MIYYICNFKQGNVDNRDGCAVFRLQNVLDEEKGWIRDQLCNSTTHRSHQKFHSQLLQFKYKGGSSDTHYSTIQNCNNCETFAHFAVFWLELELALRRRPAFRPKACLPTRLEAPRDQRGGLRKKVLCCLNTTSS